MGVLPNLYLEKENKTGREKQRKEKTITALSTNMLLFIKICTLAAVVL